MSKEKKQVVRVEDACVCCLLEGLKNRFSPSSLDVNIVEMLNGYSLSIEVDDGICQDILSIGMVTGFKEITVGYNFYDHEHFSEDIDGVEFIEKALLYIDVISKRKQK